jgi:tetratricopeptide (TPR) repeat protein
MFWSHFEAADDLSFPFTRRVIPFLWIPFLGFRLVGPLGLAGALTLWRRSAEEALLAAAVVLWMISVALFHVADRYRLAAIPLLVVLGWGFVESLLAAWSGRPRRALGVCLGGLGLLAAAAALVNGLDFYPGGQDEAPFDRVMGFGYAEDGRRDLAAEYDHRAAASFSRSAYDSLARGEVYRAESYLRATLEADPAYPGARYHHGLTLERLGRAPEAIAEYERAVAADSDAAEALTHLGRLRLEAGDLDAAERALAEALRRQPERFFALAALGDLRARQGRFAEARDLYQRALRQQPGARWVSERLARLPR